jgi:hypothetical protein
VTSRAKVVGSLAVVLVTAAACGTATSQATAAGAVGSALPPSSSPSAAPSISVVPPPVKALDALIRTNIKVAGRSHITSIEAVRTVRGRALNASEGGEDAGTDPDVAVYLIQAVGRFDGAGFSRPSGARAPAGTDLTVIVDSSSLNVSDIGLGTRPADLRLLGTPFALA